MSVYLEAWQNDGRPDAESRIKTFPVKNKEAARLAAESFGRAIDACVRVTLLYTGNRHKRRTMETLWKRPGYEGTL